MTTLHITGAPLVKTDDQRRAEECARQARRARPSTIVTIARGTFWTLAVLALVGADRVEAGLSALLR